MRTWADGKGYPDSDIYPVTSASVLPVSPGIVAALLCLQLPGEGLQTRSPDLQSPLPRTRTTDAGVRWSFWVFQSQSSLVTYLPIVNLLGLVFTSLYFPQYVLFDENRKCWLYSSQTLFSINLLDFPYQVATEVKSSLILNFQQKHYLVLQLQQHMRIMVSLQTDPWKTHLPHTYTH